MAELVPVIAYPEGCKATFSGGNRVLVGDKAGIARIVVTPWSEGLEAKVNPRTGIDPDSEEWAASPFWPRIAYSERFRMMQIYAAADIATYEYDCPRSKPKGGPAHRRVSSRVRCPANAPPVVRARDKTPKWSQAIVGKPSTRASFEGHDFPSGHAKPRRQ